MIGSRACTGVAVASMVLIAGCSREPDSKDAQADMDESRSAVRAEVKGAARVLAAGGWRIVSMGGRFSSCGGGGLAASAVRYSAGGTVTGGAGTMDQRIRSVGRLLSDAGWKVREVSSTGEGGRYSRLTRDGLALAIDPDSLQGSQDFGFGVSGECVEVTDKQHENLPGKEQIAP
jgi:hypothetical protein